MNNRDWAVNSPIHGHFKINSNIINALYNARQLTEKDLESGGVLIGCIRRDNIIEAHDITLPQRTDKQSRFSFFRSNAHNTLLSKIWYSSNGNSYFVGLWHTHPEAVPNFSIEDNADWIKVLQHGEYEGTKLMFIIVGQHKLRLWVGEKINLDIKFIGEYDFEQ